jgi:hypothetical protein
VRARPLQTCSVLVVLAAALASCGTKVPAVTGLTATVSFPGVTADQLELSVLAGSTVVLQPKSRPEQPGAALASPQSVSIYLPDALTGQTVTCVVTAFEGGAARATGSAPAMLVLNKLVPVDVELHVRTGDGGPPDGPPGDVSETDASETDASETDAGEADASDAATSGDGGLKTNGQPCGRGDECDSTLCVDGVCCGSTCGGLCEACNLMNKAGTCSPEPAGTKAALCATQPVSSCGFDGTCDGSGGCRRYPAGVGCKAEACLGTTKYVPPAACDGQGACVAQSNVDCAPYICDSMGVAPACRTTCRVGGTDCQAPAVCAADSCGAKIKKPNGAGCVDATDCTSNQCADGVCCGAACTGACLSCNQTGKEGMCLPVAAGKIDPHKMCADAGAASCGRNGLCDGMGACALYPTTAVCVAGSCNARFLRATRHCDGKGVCATAADVDCQPYRCDAATTACFTACTDNNQCSQAPRRTCNNSNVCQ